MRSKEVADPMVWGSGRRKREQHSADGEFRVIQAASSTTTLPGTRSGTTPEGIHVAS
jgi:hypothetical protein